MRLACLSETEAPLCEPWVGSRGLDRGALELGSLQNPDKKKPGFNPDFSLNQLINFFFFLSTSIPLSPALRGMNALTVQTRSRWAVEGSVCMGRGEERGGEAGLNVIT